MSSSSRTTITTSTGPRKKRTCVWCRRRVVADSRGFDGRERTCKYCKAGKALARQHNIEIRKGEGARECSDCGFVGRYSMTEGERSEFAMSKGAHVGHMPYCRVCACRRRRESYRRDPRAGRANALRKYYSLKEDPERYQEWRQRNRGAARRYQERLRQDPERWARVLTNARIDARLRAEREGRVVRLSSARIGGYVRPTGAHDVLPEAPLRAWLNALIFSKGNEVDYTELSYELGIAERQLRGILKAEYPHRSMSVADTMLTRYERPVDVPGYGLVWRIEDLWPVELGEELAA